MRKLKRGAIYVIEWGDAWADGQGWHRVDEPLAEPLVNRTVGWVVKQEPAGVVLAASVGENATISSYTFIPTGMVRGVKKLA